MMHEMRTSMAPEEVIRRAKSFFSERVPHFGAFPEKEGPRFVTFRGQGGEEVALAAAEDHGVTRVRASTLLFDQTVDRFFSTLPGAEEAIA